MTYIKSITLKGFKSFSKEITIEFDKGFSCIVGPNGSGKSNISDGILFVLGKLGSKGLRANTSANLIYNGGIGGKPAQEAMAELCLDNTSKIFPKDGKEVRVARIVRRNGTSIYKINSETKTRQEVLELLSKAAISPHGFNIILQDSISRFVEMKNEDRRMLIENIAGISVYEERKKKSLRELEKTEEKIKEINIILTERGNYLKNLERERKQALLYNKTKEDIEIGKTSLIIKKISKKESDAIILDRNMQAERKKFDKIKTEIIAMQKEATAFFNEIEKVTKRIEEATGKEQASVHHGLVEIKSNIAMLEAKKNNFAEQIKSNLEREKQLVFELEKSEESLLNTKKELREKPKKIDVKNLGKNIQDDEKKLISHIEELITKIRRLRERKVEKQELTNFLESVENVCLILKELTLRVKQNRDTLASPQKFEVMRKLEIERGVVESEISRIKLLVKRGKEENKKLQGMIGEIDTELQETTVEERSTEEMAKGFEKRFRDLFEKRGRLEKQVRAKEEEIKAKDESQWKLEANIKQIEIENAHIEEALSTLKEDLTPYAKFIDKAKTMKKSEGRLQEEISRNQRKLEGFGGINQRALEVYDEAKKEFDYIVGKVNSLSGEKVEILNVIAEIDKKKKKEFMKTFTQIAENFSRIFAKLAIKGQALLELENKENPFEEGFGLDIRIKLGKGKYLDTRSLSGGEKSLTALAFIFAIQEYKPHHFYLLDEVDAALDKRNSARLSVLIKDYVKKAQYISITHNDAMIDSADKLYGVSMQNGTSKVVSLKL